MNINEKYRLGKIMSVLMFVVLLLSNGVEVQASEDVEHGEFKPGEMIMHHIKDDYNWHFFTIGDFHGEISLPVILYSEQGLDIFSSSQFHHGAKSYKGYTYSPGHIERADEMAFTDFSITKNVAALFINAILLLVVFLSVAKGYKKNKGKAPTGIQSVFEPIIVFIRDDIAKTNIGPKYEKFMPYLLTLFFFIWFGNLIGLTPGASNLTGNIAVTTVLALFTLGFTLFNSTKYFWGHIFNPPGVPLALKPIIIPIELLGVLVSKPFSLLIRLFVAISAGHIVLLSLLSLAFIFHSFSVGIGGGIIVLFINFIELLVATIQAYVFTLFSALYIGMAVEEHH